MIKLTLKSNESEFIEGESGGALVPMLDSSYPANTVLWIKTYKCSHSNCYGCKR